MRKQIQRPLVLSADGTYEYAFATLVCLTSIFLNSAHLDFQTYWITSKYPRGAQSIHIAEAIEKLSDIFLRKITMLPIDDICFDDFIPPAQIPYLGNVTYNWWLVPNIIQCDSFLLLDSDIIVQDDLDFLFSLDIGDNIIAGVSNGTEERDKENERLGLPADNVYINTGVMIVNAERWRRENILEVLKQSYTCYCESLRLADQDVVNVVLSKRKMVLDRKWNTQLHTLEQSLQQFDADAFRGIFHFSGPEKPWQPDAQANIKALFHKYARVTPRFPRGNTHKP
jgi:lipopolysaccharide biosynthesis glycosyltransferase